MPNIYEQKRKRHALKQIQQRSKRLATQNSSSNSFSTSNLASGINPFLEPPDQNSNSSEDVFYSAHHDEIPVADTGTISFKRNPKTKQQNAEILQKTDFHIRTEDSTTFKAKQGTCMFMCSPKEFHNRLSQDIYHKLETRNGQFSHDLAVKEYKRSSADQNESETSDLRPSIVLLKTVQYLTTELIDSTNLMFEELYEFIWDRTRAIRKDITQQKLGDNNTIAVLETIVRFHIFSAYRMANSGSESFEQKYNNENLEKTLTSLRHLYADKYKISERCPNEAEFRMYHILLNLNNGHVLYWFNMLSDSVKWSPQVRYALDCYKAFNSNNYIQFFRLVKQGSLLSSCILYRYINNVREKAIVSIINSHAKNSCEYPLSKFESMLCFESIADTREYLNSMDIESNESVATLNYRCYNIVNKDPEVKMNIIERKIVSPIGRVLYSNEPVSNSVLDVAPPTFSQRSTHEVISEHSLKSVANSILAQLCLNEVVSIVESFVQIKGVLERSKILLTKDILDELCKEILKEEMEDIKSNLRKTVIQHTKNLYQDLHIELFDEIFKDLAEEAIIEESTNKFCQDTHNEILSTAIRVQLFEAVSAEAKSQIDFSNKCSNACEDLYKNVLSQSIQKLLIEVSLETVNEVRRDRKDMLNQELSKHIIQKRYYFNIWKKKYQNIMSKRHSLDKIRPRLKPSSSTEVLRKLLKPIAAQFTETENYPAIDLTSPTDLFNRRCSNFKKLQIRMDLLEEAVAIRGIPLTSFCNKLYHRPIYMTIGLHSSEEFLSSFLLDCASIFNVDWNKGYYKKQVVIKTNIYRIQVLDLDIISPNLLFKSSKFSSLIILMTDDLKFVESFNKDKLKDCLFISSQRPKIMSRFVQKPTVLSRMNCCQLYKELDASIPNYIDEEKMFQKLKVIEIRDVLQSLICSKLTDMLLSKHLVLNNSNHAYTIYPNKIISFYNHIMKTFSGIVCSPELQEIDWPSFFDLRADVSADWNDAVVVESLRTDLNTLKLPYYAGDTDSIDNCMDYIRSLKLPSLQFLIGRISVIVKQQGLVWMLILNQAIHHIIENASFERSYTIIIENHLKEIQSINSERYIEESIEWLSSDSLPVTTNPYESFQDEIADTWSHLSHYETIISSNRSHSSFKEKKENNLDGDFEKLESLENEIKELKQVMNSTESRLQSILRDGSLPHNIMNSKLLSNMS